jgi:hypothetical protein
MTTITFVVHEDGLYGAFPPRPWFNPGPRREFALLEDAQAWQREVCPNWSITRIEERSLPASEVA